MKYIIVLLIFAAVLIGTFIYSYKYYSRAASVFDFQHKKLEKAAIIVFSIITTSFLLGFVPIMTITVLHWLIIGLIFEIFNVIICRGMQVKSNGWQVLYKLGIFPVIITLVAISFGYSNMNDIIRTEYNIDTEKSIKDEGYKIGMISDLHFGVSMNINELKKQVKKIEDEDIDAFILCGDIVDENTKAEEMKEAFKVLGDVKSKYGTFYVYGNHDSLKYAARVDYTDKDLEESILSNNIKMLKDESFNLTNDFTIVGRLDASMNGEACRKSSSELLDGVNKDSFILMLDHQPLELEKNSEEGYDLQLSGHTHAGQVWPGEEIMKTFKLAELSYGEKVIGKFKAITSSGIQGWGFPVRTSSHSEYVIVNVNK